MPFPGYSVCKQGLRTVARRRRTLSRQESEYVSRGLRQLGLSSLSEYYKTSCWRSLRAAWRKSYCERCGQRGRVSLHHRTYARLGRERREDLETLCDACHRAEHGLPPRRRRGSRKR
jgi:5-methylcytosine-specific restriction endonuclease McrA